MSWFVRKSLKECRCVAFNLNYKSKFCEDISKIISEKINVKGIIYDIIEAYLNYKNKRFKITE